MMLAAEMLSRGRLFNGALMSSEPGRRAQEVQLCSLERFRGTLLWVTGVSGAFVFVEPGPYEFAALLTASVFVVTGLVISPRMMPLVLLLTLYLIGLWSSAIPVLDDFEIIKWVAISSYLTATSVFFAAMLGTNTEYRLRLLLGGYMLAAIIAAVAALVGYFHLVPELSELFLRFGRARGTFNDPNWVL